MMTGFSEEDFQPLKFYMCFYDSRKIRMQRLELDRSQRGFSKSKPSILESQSLTWWPWICESLIEDVKNPGPSLAK